MNLGVVGCETHLDDGSVELLLDGIELLLHGHDLFVAVSDFVLGISGLLLRGLELVLDLLKRVNFLP